MQQTWPILEHNGPIHLDLWANAAHSTDQAINRWRLEDGQTIDYLLDPSTPAVYVKTLPRSMAIITLFCKWMAIALKSPH